MDFDSFSKTGVSLGSGALLICSEDTCVVDLAKVLLNFFVVEGCGKCNPCRIGGKRSLDILTNISEGVASLKDLDDLILLSDNLYQLSNCGLGQTAGVSSKGYIELFPGRSGSSYPLKSLPGRRLPDEWSSSSIKP